MSDLDPIYTADDLAARYGKSRRWVLAKSATWPHVEIGRTVGFTPEQVQRIDAMQSVEPDPAAAHAASQGRRTRTS